ncbi:MAG TPA: hypothetical protein VFE60_16810 [Roseiarcus sp.]|jgi:hypothetical protein|nr:hypothetical protein [Roseiarcus sp.]
MLNFHDNAVLAWRTTSDGLVPVAENEIAAACGSELPQGQYGVVISDGNVLHLEYGSESVAGFKSFVEAVFENGDLYFDSDRARADYAKRSPAAAQRYASQLQGALQLPGTHGNDAWVARLKRLFPTAA